MDPRDRGEGVEPGGEKAARSWRPMAWEPERWRGKGLPAEVEVLMTEGARIEASEEVGFEEVPQYAWPTDEALAEGILEADRALAVLGRDGVRLAVRPGGRGALWVASASVPIAIILYLG